MSEKTKCQNEQNIRKNEIREKKISSFPLLYKNIILICVTPEGF